VITVTKEAFDAFLAAYPRSLESDVKMFCEPPARAWHDFTLGDAFASVVAVEHLYQEAGYHVPNTYRVRADEANRAV
jgi:hypothetical protein